MPKKSNQKAKLLYLQKVLLENTDENHTLTVQQLIEHLAVLEIPAERKSIYDDIITLCDFGLNIITTRGRANEYQVKERLFSLADLMLLLELVDSDKNLGKIKKKNLIDKITQLGSKYQAEDLKKDLLNKEEPVHAETCLLELRCNKTVAEHVIDFLENGKIKKDKANTILVVGNAVINDEFYAWLFKLGEEIKVVEPSNIKKDYIKYCKKILNQYK